MVQSARPSADTHAMTGVEGEALQLAAWLQASVLDVGQLPTLRLAFMGRTSDDEVQDPTISMPRQLRSSKSVLEAGMEIRYYFWDVETSRLELDSRGSSTAWKQFDIDIPRDGGIADLLEEARRPDRRFDAVICESIDRIGRFSYQSTKIEHDLEQLGIPLIAADEPMVRSTKTGKIERNAALTLLRRTKQGVAEWYVLEMLEKSRKGIETHTDQGFNVGKPCYGYIALKIKHPVPAKRAEGKHKTKLTPDPTRAQTVPRIFDLWVDDCLSYRAIAGVLNEDLETWPAPQPVDPERALGHWTGSSVREVLTNPKYTGYMAWNRRATKDKRHPGKSNPKDQWVMSSQPTHDALVSVERFLAAQARIKTRGNKIGRTKHRADAAPMAANKHRQTKTVYRLRSYIHCVLCQRRMHGKSNHAGTPYAYCQPREREMPEGHPPTIWVREDVLVGAVTHFFNTHVLGPDRLELARASIPAANAYVNAEHQKAQEAISRQINSLNDSIDNLIRVLEKTSDPQGQLFKRTERRMAELEKELAELTEKLRQHRSSAPPPEENDLGLLEQLPQAEIDLNTLAADRLRRFLDAFQVEIHYNVQTRRATLRAEISGQMVDQLVQLISRVGKTTTASRPSLTPRANENGPAGSSGSDPLIMRSLGQCPRQDSNLRSRLRRAVLYPLSYGGSNATDKE